MFVRFRQIPIAMKDLTQNLELDLPLVRSNANVAKVSCRALQAANEDDDEPFDLAGRV